MNAMTSPGTTLDRLRDRVFAGDNRACFIDRESILRGIVKEAGTLSTGDRYVFILERLLAGISTPIESDDLFLGRMVEAPMDDALRSTQPPDGWGSYGHLTLDWDTLLRKGLAAVAAEAHANAEALGTPDATLFASRCVRSVAAITAFSQRYAAAAESYAAPLSEPEKSRFLKAETALRRVPEHPADNLFSALQSVWMVHFVTSCVIGARDFALGRMDQYLLPYYRTDIAAGTLTREQAVELLAHFLMKCNEITGTATWNHQTKPIPSQASKQYLILGGRGASGAESFNELSLAFLEAAELVAMPEPVITIRMDGNSSPTVLEAAGRAATRLGAQVHFYNDDVIVPELIRRGAAPADAQDYAAVACCRVDLPGKMDSNLMLTDQQHNCVRWLLAALDGGRDPVDGTVLAESVKPVSEIASSEELLAQFRKVADACLGNAVADALGRQAEQPADQFHFESLLLDGCLDHCRDCQAGGARYVAQGHLLGGIGTIANSLAAIDMVVFREKRTSLAKLMELCKNNFDGADDLRRHILRDAPKFGNGNPHADAFAANAAEALLDALDAIHLPDRHLLLSSFYSLNSHHRWGRELPATPDGRLAGEPVSENQSPVYGTDCAGVTALLLSAAALPLRRTVMGGLNVKFAGAVPESKLAALIATYFGMGGIHVGFTFVDRATLLDAKAHPERHRSLCVRLYGFSEFFVALSEEEKAEIVSRTTNQ